MSDYRTRDQLLLAEIEGAAGTEESPTSSANAVKTRAVTFSPNFEQIDTNYVQSSLSESAPQTGGGNVQMTVPAWLKGAGAAGSAPDWGPLARAAGLSQTLLASAETGTAQAGAASTITLASGESAVDGAYVGMPITITGGTGSGQTRIISGYVGSTKVATVVPAWDTQPSTDSTYDIPANAMYRPVSSGLELLTLWHYQHKNSGDSRLSRLFAGAANMTLTVPPRQLADLSFTVTGKLSGAPTDVTRPTAPTYQAGAPRPFINARAFLGGAAVKFSEFSFDLGNDIQSFDDPAAAYGYDNAAVMMRQSTGRIVPAMALVSVRDAFSDWLASTQRSLWLSWGATAGERVSLWFPAIQYTGHETTDVRGFAAEGLPFRSVSPDAEVFMCIH